MRWFWLKHPSTYLALATLIGAAFTSHPTIAGLLIFFPVVIPLMAITVFCARHEGKLSSK